jgi:hypothetical protein
LTVFETKIAIIVQSDLPMWQKLNVTAFLMAGITAANPGIVGGPYRNADGQQFLPLSVQPIIVLTGDREMLRAIHKRALARNVIHAAYVAEMFSTNHDAANRAVFAERNSDNANLVGVGVRADRKTMDKITKGAEKHP